MQHGAKGITITNQALQQIASVSVAMRPGAAPSPGTSTTAARSIMAIMTRHLDLHKGVRSGAPAGIVADVGTRDD